VFVEKSDRKALPKLEVKIRLDIKHNYKNFGKVIQVLLML
jgi:hypothetical protein